MMCPMTISPPPLLSANDTPPIRSDDDLQRHWQRLMGERGFGTRRLWITILDSRDRVLPTLPVIEDVPVVPNRPLAATMLDALAWTLEDDRSGWSAGILLTRPGATIVTRSDRSWARMLAEEAATRSIQLRPTFLASDTAVRPITGTDAWTQATDRLAS